MELLNSLEGMVHGVLMKLGSVFLAPVNCPLRIKIGSLKSFVLAEDQGSSCESNSEVIKKT